ncbi:aminotransferase class IV family protein [Nocardia donostiensis]|uniref:Aminotransferase n=1 Tax=Nocardia donostiensis TaxID=1538463 RepID=A0A1W0BNY8_9NOCA|nr:aminotransferase class IV family protein [Nocardia donostiensis]ONM47615.1 aminotransferase [Nocardia donostiensis]OQS15040.1 aminotransferase [Nocardia donostiensis]OQS24213.1 aminotransferase [Nocardia donostiensis]
MELNGSAVTADDIGALGLVNFGHFTSMRVENGAVRGLSLHLDRLIRDCRTVFDADLDPERVRELVRHALRGSAAAVVVRVTVFDPHLELGRPGADAEPHILVSMRKAPPSPQSPVSLQSAVYSRDMPRVKHVGLFGALHQRRTAQRNGFDDAMFTTADGIVTEIATSNIGFIDTEGRLVWPKAEVLPGTTMRLISQARDEEVQSETITLARLNQFVGAVATNAAVGVRAVARVDDIRWPTAHKLIDTLRAEYESIPAQQL